MNPVLFEFNNIVIYSYSVMILIAWVVAGSWSTLEAPGIGVARRYIIESVIFAAIFSIMGAHLGYLLFNLQSIADQPIWKIIDVRDSNWYYFGGFVSGLASMVFYCRYRKLSFLKIADFFSPFLSLGYAITRLGCFLNGCCYGIATGTDWGFIFQRVDYMPRHPTQLYASAAALFIFIILRQLKNYRLYNGFVFFSYLVLYGVYRFVVEFYRASIPVFGLLTEAQIAALLMILIGLILHLNMIRSSNN